jgi:integrase
MRQNHIPSYRCYKPKNLGLVVLDGRYFYLGKYGTPESLAEYHRLIQEWLTNHKRLPQRRPATPGRTIDELILAFWGHAEQHYPSPERGSSRELDNLRHAFRPLRRLYGSTLGNDFGPLALRAVREAMVQEGLCRTTVNARVNRVRRLFKWAASVELLPPSVHQSLQTVPGLQKGRCAASEPEDVTPVPLEHVEATLPFLPDPVAALVRVQLLTGCRAGEVMVMRAMDLNTSGAVWTYRPGSHKNRHRGLERVIYLGPQAQAVVRPFLNTDLQAFLFSPRRYMDAMHARRAERRVTRRTPSELLRKRKEKPQRVPAERYDRRSCRQAIVRACAKANVPTWSPLQLRHTAATLIRAKYGVEAARVILGHCRIETSQIYAERDLGRAEQIMREIG